MLLNSKKLLLVFGAYLLGMAFFITNSQSQEISILQNHNIEQAIDIAADKSFSIGNIPVLRALL